MYVLARAALGHFMAGRRTPRQLRGKRRNEGAERCRASAWRLHFLSR
jgi:hypothetical protein